MGNVLQQQHEASGKVSEDSEQIFELDTFKYIPGGPTGPTDSSGAVGVKAEELNISDIHHGKMEKQPICKIVHASGPAPVPEPERVETRWKMRYFILKRGAIVYYNIDHEQIYDMGLVIGVELGELCFTLPGLSGHKILLQFANGDLLSFAVPLKKDALEWLEAFRHTAKESKATSPPWTTPTLEDQGGPTQLRRERHGLLFFLESGENWFNRWDQWVVRSVSLEHVLSMGESWSLVIRSMTKLGHFPLSAPISVYAIRGTRGADLRTFMIKSRVNEKEDRILTLRCENALARERWMKSISAICSHHAAPGTHVSTADGEVVEFYNLLHDVLETGKSLRWRPTQTSKPPNNSDLFFILSIDGGGTRGIIPCILLERLLQQCPNFLSRINMVAGTSNGAMVAAALADGYHPHTIREMIQLISHAVFSDQRGGRYSLSAAKWSNRFLALFCQEVWKDRKMSEAEIELLIPAFLLNNDVNGTPTQAAGDMESRVFTTTTKPGDGDCTMAQKCDDLIRDILMRSCSAPIYFPSWQNYVDGGVFAHSPADLAVAHAVSVLGIQLEKICVLSISTGTVREAIVDETTTTLSGQNGEPDSESPANMSHNYGYYQWASRLPKVIWRGMTDKTSHLCQQLLGNRFFRLDPRLDQDLALDQAELLPEMISCGESHDIQAAIAWLEQNLQEKKMKN